MRPPSRIERQDNWIAAMVLLGYGPIEALLHVWVAAERQMRGTR